MKIVVHVDRLVLDGFAFGPREASAVRTAVASELTRLLGATPPAALGEHRAAVAAPAIRLAHGAGAAQAGRSIARSVRRGLGE